MARKQAGDLHKVTVILAGRELVRVCVNCAASWQLVTLGTLEEPFIAWKPIREVDENGREIHRPIHVSECEYVEDEPPTKPERVVSRGGFAAVDSAASTARKQKDAICYCKACKGSEPHYEGSKFCHCNSCGGKRTHYAA